MFIYRLIQALEGKKVNYAIAGGYAVALHGVVRGTVDIDLVLRLSKKNLLAAEAALTDLGLQSRLPLRAGEVFDFREEYIRNKNLIAWNFINLNNPVESVDIIITEDFRNMKVKRIVVGGRILRVVSIEDLIKMKKKSKRPQDLEDIKALRSLKK
ncbi:MAG TPA: DUF6036 family nucleotidyltransferase [Thermodesulfobacteriota bacterium]|nr:DUF6036 family nucleotidyltransferase [Thermodesulfobacteriota bacterium]